jgi:hypothetical protein
LPKPMKVANNKNTPFYYIMCPFSSHLLICYVFSGTGP